MGTIRGNRHALVARFGHANVLMTLHCGLRVLRFSAKMRALIGRFGPRSRRGDR
jgi:hypothetical protein